ncbi:hypothetical protein [Paenibacillus sp. P46E]|uniref:hypothetical protein n=1 Tax=Paenibacillus sp. P46E TaxID=1349436 RepID=UPI0009401D52|nr:hypothetical protein [Paenibacillus sp. P46E]OKP97214.1 hypothetical protein A3849_16655 [Paenibacillus sp. P46E]
MGSLIYVAAIIIIAIISSLNKAGKKKGGTASPGGMPSFGSGGGNPLQPSRRTQSNQKNERSGFPVPGGDSPNLSRPLASFPVPEYDASPAWPESAESPSPDYQTGEGVSLEQAREDGVQVRAERMERELKRLESQFSGSASTVGSGNASKRPDAVQEVDRDFRADRKALRDGLRWAEILGPPRSRQSRTFRR